MMYRKFTILILSFACYVYFTQWSIMYFLFLSLLIICSNRSGNKTFRKSAGIISAVLLIVGFIFLKSAFTRNVVLGYSVFAFCGISFIVDQFKTEKKYDVLDILLYLFFFPKMLAGPIIRMEYFCSQLAANTPYRQTLYRGIKLLIYSCFLKFIVADIVLDRDMNGYGFNLFVQMIIWGIRFYIDFYAYSLIAVGVALLVGIQLPYNFDNPYSALSFRNFWHRWNITLTQWLSEYVYIPLGGSRCSIIRTCLNIVVTFIISGLWHGITLTFVMWGICHGILVCIERLLISEKMNEVARWIYRIFVILVTILLWQLFRLRDFGEVADFAKQLSSFTKLDGTTMVYGGGACLLLYLIEAPITKRLMLGNENSQCNVICEVSVLSSMLAIMVLCPLHFTFNFFYLRF